MAMRCSRPRALLRLRRRLRARSPFPRRVRELLLAVSLLGELMRGDTGEDLIYVDIVTARQHRVNLAWKFIFDEVPKVLIHDCFALGVPPTPNADPHPADGAGQVGALHCVVEAAEAEGVLAGHHHGLHHHGEADGAHRVPELHLVTGPRPEQFDNRRHVFQ